jgi:CheY-like chemotaxis protein
VVEPVETPGGRARRDPGWSSPSRPRLASPSRPRVVEPVETPGGRARRDPGCQQSRQANDRAYDPTEARSGSQPPHGLAMVPTGLPGVVSRTVAVLLDVRLPDINGFEVARSLLGHTGPVPLVVLTSSHDYADLSEAIGTSGVSGFIPKGELTGTALAAMVG